MSQRIVLVFTNGQVTQKLEVEANTPEEALEKAVHQALPPKHGDNREFRVWK